jgi:hypothetical protein
MNRRAMTSSAIATALVGIVGGCATAQMAGSPAVATVGSVYAGALTTPRADPEAGVTLSPPDGLTPALSWQAAFATCATGESVCVAGRDPSITLALATTTGAGTMQTDGTTVPLMKDTLVYVMTWRNEPCVPKGGPPTSAAPSPRPCTLVAFVDATTGRAIYGAEGPTVDAQGQ